MTGIPQVGTVPSRPSALAPGRPISLSIFFPAYYDEHNIPKVVEGALRVVEEMGIAHYEIIIVEDGSPDRTGEVADRLAAAHQRVRVIHHERNMGYGAALRTGFTSARMDYVFYTDGDNQFDLQELKKFVALVPYTDIVSGFRVAKQYSTYRKFTSFVYNLVLRLLFDIHDRDVDCAFKLYPTELFRRITIESRDAFIDAEIAIKARLLGYRSTEVGVTHLPRLDGISTGARPSVILRTIGEIVRAYRKYRKDIVAARRDGR
jgi:glycosyltransferase involved in cell wall biosynthesis